MNKTAIEWCDSTWNPVTGCFHNCPYCYAARIAKRFKGVWDGDNNTKIYLTSDTPIEVTGGEFNDYGLKYRVGNDSSGKPRLINPPYPYGFHPTLHRHRLESGVQQWKNPRNIFVCSMADLFGDWVPDEWIKRVFEECAKAPQHRYLFLTKNPKRYEHLIKEKILPPLTKPYYFGHSITSQKDANNYWNWHFSCYLFSKYFRNNYRVNRFISVEPLHEKIWLNLKWFPADWVIIGAETGNRKDKIIPKREWIEAIVEECEHWEIPVFMKDSLKKIWKEPLIQEYPWPGRRRHNGRQKNHQLHG